MWTRGREWTIGPAMLLVTAVSLASLVSGVAWAQVPGGVWAPRPPMPTARHLLAAAVVDGKVYAVGGMAGLAGPWAAAVEEYDPSTQAWTAKAPMPTARYRLATTAANGRLYAVGGSDVGILATVEEYDTATDTWVTKAPMPTPRERLGVGAVNGRLYAIGGRSVIGTSVTTLATVEEYDPATDSWTTKAPMPTARESLAVAAGANGKLYAVGGTGASVYSTVEEYDPATDTWATKAPMLIGRHGLGLAVAHGKLYAIGGIVRAGKVTVEEYDPATNTWVTKGPMPEDSRDMMGVAAANGKINVAGGCGLVGCPSANVDEYDPAG